MDTLPNQSGKICELQSVLIHKLETIVILYTQHFKISFASVSRSMFLFIQGHLHKELF